MKAFKYQPIALFLVLWLWASWWMSDCFRICYEHSYFVPDADLMSFLLQQSGGYVAALGRALILLLRYPWLGGLAVALLLLSVHTLLSSLLRLPRPWQWVALLPVVAWMTWVAWPGFNLYFQAEPGTRFGWLIVGWLVVLVLWTAKWLSHHKGAVVTDASPAVSWQKELVGLVICVVLLTVPFAVTHLRHPYLRPVTRMQVQLLHQDWDGMSATAHENAELSYRPLAAFYAIALAHNGHLTDQLFDIRLDYDTLYFTRYGNQPDNGTSYYLIDCDYHAGLIRPATHKAMEHMTMQGPTLYTLKHLAKCALIEGDWPLARKYLHILKRQPFEGDFVDKYSAMLGHMDAVLADPEIQTVMQAAPVHDDFEGGYQDPIFLGYHAVRTEFKSSIPLMYSLMVNLYSKRMPDFLVRTQPLIGATPPRTIAQGLVTQTIKYPEILQAFPMLNMDVQNYRSFVSAVREEMKDRPANARKLFNSWRGYFPYYYFFGNLRATRPTPKASATDNGAVN